VQIVGQICVQFNMRIQPIGIFHLENGVFSSINIKQTAV